MIGGVGDWFDAGGRPSIILYPPLALALAQVQTWEPRRIAATLAPLVARVAAAGEALGFTVPRQHAPHIVGLRPPAALPSAEALEAFLKRPPYRIHVAARWYEHASHHPAAPHLLVHVSSQSSTSRS